MTTTLGVESLPGHVPPRPALAKSPVFLIAACAAAVLLAVSGRYGYFGDELYFIAAGHELSWGYADQPPALPLIALLMDTIAPGSLVALRVPAILAHAAGTVLSALIARELGGQRRAQVLTATAHATAYLPLTTTLATPVLDILMWTVLGWLVIRWVRGHSERAADDRLLVWAGVAVAVGMQVKFQMGIFVLALLVCFAAVGPREVLRRPMLWLGAGIAVVASTPTLIWQAMNGWPQLEMSQAVAAEVAVLGPVLNFVLMFAGMGVGLGFVLGAFGLWRLLMAEELRPYRFMAVTAALLVAIFVATSGRSYYVAGIFPTLWAAGAVSFQWRRERKVAEGKRTWSWVAWPAAVLSALVPIQALPIQPAESYAGKPFNMAAFLYLGQFGWPQMADTVAGIYRSLPAAQRDSTTIITSDYWAASALRFYGDDFYGGDLPTAYSGARGFWYFGHPPETANTVIHVGVLADSMKRHFDEVRKVGTLDNGMDVASTNQGMPVFLATGKDAPWARIWPEFRRINLVP